jgi:hypothetical protein
MTPIRSFKPQPTGRTIAAAGKTQENHGWRGGAWPISCGEMWKRVEKRRPAKAGLESRSYLESSDQAVLV